MPERTGSREEWEAARAELAKLEAEPSSAAQATPHCVRKGCAVAVAVASRPGKEPERGPAVVPN